MSRQFLEWSHVRPLLRSHWLDRSAACVALWEPAVQAVLNEVTRSVAAAWRSTLPLLDADDLAGDVAVRLCDRAARNGGLGTPAVTSGNAAPWMAEVFRNAALDEVDAALRHAGQPSLHTRRILRDVKKAAKDASATSGRPAQHAEVAEQLQMPLHAFWSMLSRHGIRGDGAWGSSLAANGPIEVADVATAATQERGLLDKDEAEALEAAVRAGRLRPCHRLAWFCAELPHALDDALIEAAAADGVDGRGLARSAPETAALLDRWLALAGEGAHDRTARLRLAWILRTSEPLLGGDLVATAEGWRARDRAAADARAI
jgi:hypothetical protein